MISPPELASDPSESSRPAPSLDPPPLLGVLASGSGTNFDAIARAIAEGRLDAQIAVVVCNNPDAGVVALAADHGIECVIVDHRAFADRDSFDAAVIAALVERGVEWVVMAGWMRLVTEAFIATFEPRILNIHPSLLPSFRGLRAVEQALEAGVKITGVTVHHVVPAVDSGPIVAQAAVPVLAGDTAHSLHARIQVAEHQLYPAAIALAVGTARAAQK